MSRFFATGSDSESESSSEEEQVVRQPVAAFSVSHQVIVEYSPVCSSSYLDKLISSVYSSATMKKTPNELYDRPERNDLKIYTIRSNRWEITRKSKIWVACWQVRYSFVRKIILLVSNLYRGLFRRFWGVGTSLHESLYFCHCEGRKWNPPEILYSLFGRNGGFY